MASSEPFSDSRRAKIAKALKNNGKGAPRVMAIVNCTPDSFHEESRAETFSKSIERCIQALDSGAEWIDIGGESTRPGAIEVSLEDEIQRVVPTIKEIRKLKPDALISIDTRNVEVARQAIDSGADLINDVSGLRDKAMEDLVVSKGCGVCIMHMLGEPRNMQNNPEYSDVVKEVSQSLLNTAERLVERGHPPELICLDPGIGFGKNLKHNLDLLRNPDSLRGDFNFSILWGVSRKSMFSEMLGRLETQDRLSGTLGVAAVAQYSGIDILRVHDVIEHIDLLKTISEINN